MHGQQERLLRGLVIANVPIKRSDGHLTDQGCACVARSQGIPTARVSLPGLGRPRAVSQGALGIPRGTECCPIVVSRCRFVVPTVQRDWLVAKFRVLVDELSLLQGNLDTVAFQQVSQTGLIHSLDGKDGIKAWHPLLIIVHSILNDGFAGIGATVVPV